jgi:cytochrome c oxidase cbb3-type subunit III
LHLRDRCLGTLVAIVALGLLPACRREARKFGGPAWENSLATGVRIDQDASTALPERGTPGPFDGNAWGTSEGQRLYGQMNCVGCHALGGGGMGPALMDGAWRYGDDDATVFTTIVGGRPNGMPAFRGRLSDEQVWQLVAYVKALGGRAPKQSESARDDHMAARPGPLRTEPQPTVHEEVPQ